MLNQNQNGKEKYYTNQKANSAANLFAIHFSHFHAVPKTESSESQKESRLSSSSEAHLEKQTYLARQADWCGATQRHLCEQLAQVCKGFHASFSRTWNTSIVKKVNAFFWLCHWFARWLLEIIWFLHTLCSNHASKASPTARRGSSASLLLSGTHSQPCIAVCTNLRKGYRSGSIFCWVSFSPCQSDHQSAAQTLVLAYKEGDGNEGMSRDESAFFRDSVHLNWSWNYSISSSSAEKQNDTDLLCKMLQDLSDFPQ